jgi:hypothetical protein
MLRTTTPYRLHHRPKARNVLIVSIHNDSLINTNSYLRDSKQREALLIRTVVSSTAVEGVHLDWADLKELRSLSNSNKNIKSHVPTRSSESRR